MQVTPKSRRDVRLQNIAFIVLLLAVIAVLAWLSTRYSVESDWTASGRNSLSQASIELLTKIKEPVEITAYASDDPALRRDISTIIGLYQRHKPDIQFSFINPSEQPEQARALGIAIDGELLIEYQGRNEHLRTLDEQSITNAMQRLMRSGERWLVFVEGHGERKPQGSANHDLSLWARQLEGKGFKIQSLNLGTLAQIPENTAVLVIAGPQMNYLPGEVKLIMSYVQAGGNLLWLTDPGPGYGLEPLAKHLELEILPGTVIDPTGQMLSIDNPGIAIVSNYGGHAITREFNNITTLYPLAAAMVIKANKFWESHAVLSTHSQSWLETGGLRGALRFDPGKDVRGPLQIGVALNRVRPVDGNAQRPEQPAQQRVVVIGDGDFLSNAFLNNAGNLDFGMNIVHWLSHDDSFIAIPAKTSPDVSLMLSETAAIVIIVIFLLVLPITLAGSGVIIWWRRRKR